MWDNFIQTKILKVLVHKRILGIIYTSISSGTKSKIWSVNETLFLERHCTLYVGMKQSLQEYMIEICQCCPCKKQL